MNEIKYKEQKKLIVKTVLMDVHINRYVNAPKKLVIMIGLETTSPPLSQLKLISKRMSI